MNNRTAAVVTQDDRPTPLHVVGETITVLAAVERTGTYEVFLQAGAEGAGPPPHSHEWDESFYVVRGSVHFSVDGREQTATSGTFVYIPGGTIHCFRIGEVDTEMLSITSRAGAAAMFTELDAKIAPAAPDLPTLVDIVSAHGVKVQLAQ